MDEMAEIDYQAWVQRVKGFSEALPRLPGKINIKLEIAPPISDETLAEVTTKWNGRLPGSLRKFWQEGASAIGCRYVWTPPADELSLLHEVFELNNYIYGGVRFEPASSIYPGNSGADPDDEFMVETLGKEGLALLCKCAIFLWVGDGDALGLDPDTNPDDPAVIYLVHDEPESMQISPSFSEFLSEWEKLSYIGPDIGLLHYWLDSDRGALDATKHKTAQLRMLLTPRP